MYPERREINIKHCKLTSILTRHWAWYMGRDVEFNWTLNRRCRRFCAPPENYVWAVYYVGERKAMVSNSRVFAYISMLAGLRIC